ncbi:hypothetical protein [Pseudotenacibaculum haliotis]|uniref:Uncharacterized protein n=1 Tax=Pseudotenacibaculum haliotis TaxID=1862138 RepID=A0ABW5LVJ6_9FLAO
MSKCIHGRHEGLTATEGLPSVDNVGCTKTKSDSFQDWDKDGLWDDNEPGTIIYTTDCGPCSI